MKEFALVLDGKFQEVRWYKEQPADIPHKKVKWFPVDREFNDLSTQEHTDVVNDEGIERGKYVYRTTKTDKHPGEIDGIKEARKAHALNELKAEGTATRVLFKALYEVSNELKKANKGKKLTESEFEEYLWGLL